MTRKCSHCNHNGHNSRTCSNKVVKLFGVQITEGSIRKSASMGNLTLHTSSSNVNHHHHHTNINNHPVSPGETPDHHSPIADGYASEDFVKGSSSSCRERKKGTPWTEEEHRLFLLGLQKLGKGDWRGISRSYVKSRTPTQVASHAQKYFIRQCNMSRRKRRSSLFDIIADETEETTEAAPGLPISHSQAETQNNLFRVPSIEKECESMESMNGNTEEPLLPNLVGPDSCYPVIFPVYYPPVIPFSVPLWLGYPPETTAKDSHHVVKPMATHSPINVNELVGMSKLSLVDSLGEMGPSPSSLSLQLPEGDSTRQSAFHANPATRVTSTVNSSGSPIHAL